jgi:hypothetical protein
MPLRRMHDPASIRYASIARLPPTPSSGRGGPMSPVMIGQCLSKIAAIRPRKTASAAASPELQSQTRTFATAASTCAQ